MDITTNTASAVSKPVKKINDLLTKQKLTLNDVEHFTRAERDYLGRVCTKRLAKLKGDERDRFLDKIDSILPAEARLSLWEHNHNLISNVISGFMDEYGLMPTREYVAGKTGLSRQTVAKHFNDYTRNPMFQAEMDQFKIMSNRILAKVYKSANRGDMRAAKLYFEMVGALNKQQPGTVVNEQNNYIQINNTILSQQNLKQLSAEQLNQIEGIINGNKSKVLSLEA